MKQGISPTVSAVIVAVVIVLIAVGGIFYMRGPQSAAPSPEDMRAMQNKAMQAKSQQGAQPRPVQPKVAP